MGGEGIRGGSVKYSDTPTKLTEQQAALAKLEGYPKAPSFVGTSCKALVQKDPSFGSTTAIAEVIDTLDGKGDLNIDPALFAKHAGKSAVVNGKTIVIAAPPVKP